MKNINLKKIEKFAEEKHKGQFRRDGKTPYIEHPKRVAELLDTDEEKAVALLHDVLEDTDTNMNEIIKLFGGIKNVVEIIYIFILTKERGSYEDYIKKIKDNLYHKHVTPVKVKIADIVSNLTDNPTEKQIRKYLKALFILAGVE
jgi:(p)ppGpp synthase/HD superfamily hydrolase